MGIKLGSFGGTTSTRNYPGPGSYNFFSDFEGFSKGNYYIITNNQKILFDFNNFNYLYT